MSAARRGHGCGLRHLVPRLGARSDGVDGGDKLDAGRLRVERQFIPTPGGCTFGPPKSRRSERTVALDPVTVEALRQHHEVQQLERLAAGPAYDDGDLVFCNEVGQQPAAPHRGVHEAAQGRRGAHR
jgi:hypothetical protein